VEAWFVDRALPGLFSGALMAIAVALSHVLLRRHITRTTDRQTGTLTAGRPVSEGTPMTETPAPPAPEGGPHFGFTRHGLAVHLRAADHQPAGTAYERFNKKVALGVTGFVGSMTAAWLFCLLALLSLPAVLTQAFGLHFFPHWLVAVGLIALVAWIAQTFLQLVLLSVIMVGQNVQQAAADARAAKTFEDVETVRSDIRTALDRLDTRTEGGLAEVLAAVRTATAMTGNVIDAVQPGCPATALTEANGNPGEDVTP
jgi:hypothetical protein